MKLRLGVISAALVLALAVGAGASASASVSSKSTPAQDVAKAKAAVKPFLEIPTKVTAATPLPTPAPTGSDKTVVYITCDNAVCAGNANGVAGAAAALGWGFKSIPFKLADTSTFISAMDSALAFKPVFVAFTGVVAAAWAGEIPKYKAAGVGIVPSGAGAFKPDKTLLGYNKDLTYVKVLAQMLGEFFIEDSGGTGHALFLRFNEQTSTVGFATEFQKIVSKNCSKCKVSLLDATLAQLGGGAVAGAVVSAVQADPSITQVLTPVGSAINGLRAALNNIGKSNVKIGGYTGSYQNYLNIASGAENVWVNESKSVVGYTILDTGLHGMAGGKTQYKTDTFPPLFLVTKDNLPNLGGPEAAKATSDFNLPSNAVALYRGLWGLPQK